jgi:hypothetical protein
MALKGPAHPLFSWGTIASFILIHACFALIFLYMAWGLWEGRRLARWIWVLTLAGMVAVIFHRQREQFWDFLPFAVVFGALPFTPAANVYFRGRAADFIPTRT